MTYYTTSCYLVALFIRAMEARTHLILILAEGAFHRDDIGLLRLELLVYIVDGWTILDHLCNVGVELEGFE